MRRVVFGMLWFVPLACVLAFSATTQAGEGRWTTSGPYGGEILAMAVDPQTPTTLYAATRRSGIFKSTDAGVTWNTVNTGLTSLFIESLVIDPVNPATIYAGSYDEVFKSTDSGGSWADASDDMVWATALAIDPAVPSNLYAGGGGILLRSTDSGATWTFGSIELSSAAAPSVLPSLGSVTSLAVDPVSPATVYAGLEFGGVLKSTDSGRTWLKSATGLDTHVRALAIDPRTPTTIYAGTQRGVYKSTDSGATWTAAWTGMPLWTDVYSLAIDPTTPSRLYAGTDRYGAFRSTDGGAHWAPINTGLGFDMVRALAVDPRNPATLHAGTYGAWAFRSTDGGDTWTAASSGPADTPVVSLAIHGAAPATVYAGTVASDGSGAAVFKTTDSGSRWAPVAFGMLSRGAQALAIDPTAPATVYAGNASVYKSTNAATSWTEVSIGRGVSALAIHPTDGVTLYAGVSSWWWGDRGLFKSVDGGGNWLTLNLDESTYALAIDPSNPATVFAGTAAGIARSTDAGATWAVNNLGLGAAFQATTALGLDPISPTTVYAVTGGGLFKSVDGGATWASSGAGLPSGAPRLVSSIAIDPATPSTLYVGTTAGVFLSTNAGVTWTAINRALGNLTVHALALDSALPRTLYAATDAGVWQMTLPMGAIRSDLALTLSDSPDPATGTTPVIYTLTATNAGPDVANSVILSATLPAGVVLDSAGGPGWSCAASGSLLTCTRPSLAVGASSALTVRVTPGPAAAVLVTTASITAAEVDPTPANNSASETTTVNQALSWFGTRSMTVVADTDRFAAGSGVTYTVTLVNGGTQAQGDNSGHEFEFVLPSSLSLGSAGASSGATSVDLPGNAVHWDGGIPSGGTVTLTIHATIEATVGLGATVSSQGTAHYDADGSGTNEATALTDEPNMPGSNDPTTFIVVSPPMDFYLLPPCRLLDTREANGPFGGPPLQANAVRVFPVVGRCGVPSEARALSANVTVTVTGQNGHLTLYPAGSSLPNTSSINYSQGQTRANNAFVGLNGLGELAIFCGQSDWTTSVIVDVNGYYR